MTDESNAFEPFRAVTARPEHELLLLLCARSGGEELSRRVSEFVSAGGLDWEYFLNLAQRHAIVPLVQRGLESHARGLAPEPVRKSLRERYRANAARNVLLAGELLRV